MVGGKEFLHRMKDTKVNFGVVGKPSIVLINTIINDFPIEIQYLLNEHMDSVVDDLPSELPLVISVSHHVDLILGDTFSNKTS